jgi:hypothetical protein
MMLAAYYGRREAPRHVTAKVLLQDSSKASITDAVPNYWIAKLAIMSQYDRNASSPDSSRAHVFIPVPSTPRRASSTMYGGHIAGHLQSILSMSGLSSFQTGLPRDLALGFICIAGTFIQHVAADRHVRHRSMLLSVTANGTHVELRQPPSHVVSHSIGARRGLSHYHKKGLDRAI